MGGLGFGRRIMLNWRFMEVWVIWRGFNFFRVVKCVQLM
jgi:hypothetical protein